MNPIQATEAKPVRILSIDDDQEIQALLQVWLNKAGFELTTRLDPSFALQELKQAKEQGAQPYDLILCDIQMPDMDGLEFVSSLIQSKIKVPVVLMTAHGSMETAIQAIRRGATDYLIKPFQSNELLLTIERVLKITRLEQDNTALREELKQAWTCGEMLGKSSSMQNLFSMVRRVATTHVNVLITGESGTGKELIARAVHNLSPRADKPFIALNCAAVPESLLESELFGHARGSFTGATQARRGLFEEASGGTLFLDEIGDMAFPLQAKLLRVLQERKVRPLGENKDRDVDVRIIAATHTNLRQSIRDGKFREDLYFRLSVIPVSAPALRERGDDILFLAQHFLEKFSHLHGVSLKGFEPAAVERLLSYRWPGNVRELQNTVERAVILAEKDVLQAKDIVLAAEHEHSNASMDTTPTKMTTSISDQSRGHSATSGNLEEECLPLREIEGRHIQYVLEKTGGKKELAARLLGIDRKTLYRKEKELNLGNEQEEQMETKEQAAV